MRKVRLIAGLVGLVAMFAVLGGTAQADILLLNSYNPVKAGDGPTVTTRSTLQNGKYYLVSATGTVSFINAGLWTAPPAPFQVCGTPESRPYFPSYGAPSSMVGDDPEVIFAAVARPTVCGPTTLPRHYTNFQMDVGDGFQHYEPVKGPWSSPAPWHTYFYIVVGHGQKATFKILDNNTTDNDGQFLITTWAVPSSDCGHNGWWSFRWFKSQNDCSSFMKNRYAMAPYNTGSAVDPTPPLPDLDENMPW